MLTHLTGGPYLALVPLLPLFVLLVLRRAGGLDRVAGVRGVDGAGDDRASISISSEVLATATLFGAIALALAFALLPERRPALLDMVKLLIGALAVTVVVVSPYLLLFLVRAPLPAGRDVLLGGPDVVRDPSLAGRAARAITAPPAIGSSTETYLGVPLLILIAVVHLAGAAQPRDLGDRAGRCWSPVICALGATLFVRGHKTSIPVPWWCWSSCRSCATRSRSGWRCSTCCRRR